MQTTTVTTADEQEVIKLINTHLPCVKNFDSIVAEEELGNQHWVISVDSDLADFAELQNDNATFRTRNLLNVLAYLGIIAEGDYNIDCTW